MILTLITNRFGRDPISSLDDGHSHQGLELQLLHRDVDQHYLPPKHPRII
jgi:hypothetical protein